MASLLAQQDPRLLTAEEFDQIDFGPDLKAELDNGFIRMMAGGSRNHARVQANVLAVLRDRLRGSGCRPYGADMSIQTRHCSIRYPDVTVDCGSVTDTDKDIHLSAPRVVVEVLSPSTAAQDRGVKLDEYKALASVQTIALIDPDRERLRIVQRTGTDPDSWSDIEYTKPQDLVLPGFGLTIAHADLFARD